MNVIHMVLPTLLAMAMPVWSLAQNTKLTNCHTIESAGNFVGPDETIVNGNVCKIVKEPSGVAQTGVPQSASPTATGQDSNITNARVVDMTKLGLDDEIIIARIKRGPCQFQLADADLMELKKAGVSAKVVAAMLGAAPAAEASAPTDQPSSDGKVRVFITDSQSWESRGSSAAGGNRNGWGASSSFSGGARPQTAEIIKTVNQRCPELTVTNNLGRADFVLTLDHEGGKALLAHRNKIAVFNRDGDDIFSNSTRELGNAVKDACQAMLKSRK